MRIPRRTDTTSPFHHRRRCRRHRFHHVSSSTSTAFLAIVAVVLVTVSFNFMAAAANGIMKAEAFVMEKKNKILKYNNNNNNNNGMSLPKVISSFKNSPSFLGMISSSESKSYNDVTTATVLVPQQQQQQQDSMESLTVSKNDTMQQEEEQQQLLEPNDNDFRMNHKDDSAATAAAATSALLLEKAIVSTMQTTASTATAAAAAVKTNKSSSSSSSLSPTSSTLSPSSSSSLSSSSLARAWHLLNIIQKDVVIPIIQVIIRDGIPTTTTTSSSSSGTTETEENNIMNVIDSWDAFWDRPVSISTVPMKQHQHQNQQYSNNGKTTTTTSTTRSLATQITLALEQMGPTYVKFGQALSARPDIVPRSLAKALSLLQDQMQPFDTNLAKQLIREELTKKQQQKKQRMDSNGSNNNDDDETIILNALVESLSEVPVAAASIGQVYSGELLIPLDNNEIVNNTTHTSQTKTKKSTTIRRRQKVAIKVQRPGIREMVEQDAILLQTIVKMIESIPAIPGIQDQNQNGRLISTDLSGAVKEFMSRIFEELDYTNEAKNIQTFSNLYSHRRHHQHHQNKDEHAHRPSSMSTATSSGSSTTTTTTTTTASSKIQVVVPNVYMDYCTENVLVMEWIDGVKLVDLDTQESTRESLALIQQGIDCTLSQLLDTGVLHADPHGGNLLKVLEPPPALPLSSSSSTKTAAATTTTTPRLGYVDFGLLSTVPETVRDGLICAVAELIFAQNIPAVADLFGELQLIPQEILSNPTERAALSTALDEALSSVLQYHSNDKNDETNSPRDSQERTSSTPGTTTSTTTIPSLRFDKLLDALSRLVPRFQFQLPPYFLNNARALGTLEGMAREIDPKFNVLQSLYPYALEQLLSNPRNSSIVDATLQNLIRSPITGLIDPKRVQKLVNDACVFTGYSKRKVIRDILASSNGPKIVRTMIQEQLAEQLIQRTKRLTKLANLFRL